MRKAGPLLKSIRRSKGFTVSKRKIVHAAKARTWEEPYTADGSCRANEWIHFASDCVKEEKYVEFHRVSNPTAEKNRWMEATLAGLKRVRDTLGLDAAQKICELVTNLQCPYPFEMQEAAKCLQNDSPLGGSLT